MGAFWDAWNKQGAANNAGAMAGMQQAQGLAALMKQGHQMQQQQRLQGMLADPNLSPEQKRAGLMGLMTDPGQVANMFHQQATEKATNDLRTAQLTTQQRIRKAAAEQRVAGAAESLQGLLSPDVSQRDGMQRTPFVGSEAELVKYMQTNPGVYSRVDPMQVRGLQAVIDPRETMKGILAPPKQDQGRLMNVSPGGTIFDPTTRQPVFNAPFAPRAERETPLTPIQDPNNPGKFIWGPKVQGQEAPRPAADLRIDAGAKTLARQYFNDFEKDATVKRFKEITPAAEALVPYMESMSKPGAVSNNVADLNLTKLYLGVTRQKGENLTNMDKKGLAALAPVGTRIGQSLSNFFAGKDLSDEVRKDMWKTVAGHMAELNNARLLRKAEFTRRAQQNGIDPALIFGANED